MSPYGGPGKHCAQWKMPVTEDHMWHDSILYQNVQNRKIYTDKINQWLLRAGGRGKREGGMWGWLLIGTKCLQEDKNILMWWWLHIPGNILKKLSCILKCISCIWVIPQKAKAYTTIKYSFMFALCLYKVYAYKKSQKHLCLDLSNQHAWP